MMQLVFACEINIRPKTGLVVDQRNQVAAWRNAFLTA